MIKILAALLGLAAAVSLFPAPLFAQDSGPSVDSSAPAATPPKAKLQIAKVSIVPGGDGLPPLRETYNDWQLRCDKPAGGGAEHCALMQNVIASDPKGIGLSAIVLNGGTADTRLIRVLTPLGVLLPGGLGLRIDDADVGVAGFARCLPNGCVAEVMLDDALLARFKKGNQATFVVFQTPDLAIGIPVSLAGFSKGFGAL